LSAAVLVSGHVRDRWWNCAYFVWGRPRRFCSSGTFCRLRPFVCPSVRFYSVFWTDWSLNSSFWVCVMTIARWDWKSRS